MASLEIKRITKEGYLAKCEKCRYEWVYTKGIPKYWISCPKCKSKRNSLNRYVFGKWHPNSLSGTNKSQVIEK